jgi:hypothetical protein
VTALDPHPHQQPTMARLAQTREIGPHSADQHRGGARASARPENRSSGQSDAHRLASWLADASKTIASEQLAAVGVGLSATRQVVAELRATVAEHTRAIAALSGMTAALGNSVRALEMADVDDPATEIRRLLDQLTFMARERDRQVEEIARLRAELKGLRRKLGGTGQHE